MRMLDGFLFAISVCLSRRWNPIPDVVGLQRVHGKRIEVRHRIEKWVEKDRWGPDLSCPHNWRCYLNCLHYFLGQTQSLPFSVQITF